MGQWVCSQTLCTLGFTAYNLSVARQGLQMSSEDKELPKSVCLYVTVTSDFCRPL